MVKLKQILFLEMLALIALNLAIFAQCENIRDPFYLPQTSKNIKKYENIKLFGIIQSAGKICAIISVDECEETVVAGDNIAGFIVGKIGDDHVVLTKGKINKKLFLER